MTTREIQKEERRQKILICALELFVKNGYAETKISDIAKAANMSEGLMFHYFGSKEQLYETIVQMGAEGMKKPQEIKTENPIEFFEVFLKLLFDYAKKQPWVFYMFVLMARTRRGDGVPERAKEIAMSVNQIEQSAKVIKAGQKMGVIKNGNPIALSTAFWCSVQGIMEQIAAEPNTPFPKPEWIVDILRNK